MAMTKCKECGKEVSTKAFSCPSCGAQVKESSGKQGCGILLFAVFVFILIVLFSPVCAEIGV